MKRIILISVSLLLIITQYAIAGVIQPARLMYLEGEILFRTPDADEWLPASINTPLDEGDAVWCPDGTKAEIQLPDGSMLRLDGGSQLNILANEDKFVHLNLASGRLYLRTTKISSTNSLQIDADDTTVLPADRTRLRLDMLPNGEEDVSIFKGSAYVEGNGGRTRVRAGEHIALEEGHSELLALNAPDDWESWNMDRDRAMSSYGKAGSYLPEELSSYSGELESSGSWVRVPEYGMVWRPTVILSDDWVPYRNGRWIWRGNDYVWISYERWGWVPYHYGRWAVIGSLGWCWVPPDRGDVFWGPGYVGWYRTDSHIGWTPLAPGEIFYGYGYYGRHSVNVSTTTVNVNSVDYRNRYQRGGLTVLQRNDFLRGEVTRRQPALNSSVSVSVSAGSPRIKPLRETRVPAAGPIQRNTAFPRIEHQDNRELRQRFPRIITSPSDSREHRQQAPPVTVTPQLPGGSAPQYREQPQRQSSPPAQRQTNIQPAVKPGAVPPQKVLKQRKVWKIRAAEGVRESEPKVTEPKVTEPRARERRDR